jgi:hypothetical protein
VSVLLNTTRRYVTTGIAQPVNADGSSVFKAGSTVPLKFAVSDEAGTPATGLAPKLRLAPLAGSIWGTELEAVSSSSADTGSTFREAAAGSYVFNLSTKGMAVGTWQARIDLGDGTQIVAQFSLR